MFVTSTVKTRIKGIEFFLILPIIIMCPRELSRPVFVLELSKGTFVKVANWVTTL